MQERLRQTEMVERAAAQVYRASPPLSTASFDFRDRRDHRTAERARRPRIAAGAAPQRADGATGSADGRLRRRHHPRPAGPDFSALERHLLKITSQIEAPAIGPTRSSNRSRRSAANSPRSARPSPRRCRAAAIESIENEVRSLHRRIDEIRQEGSNGHGQAIAGIERALSEIREALRTLTPAEQLTGYDEAIRNLGAKLDTILRANDDPSTVQQLEGAIAALRAIVSNVASNDALLRLSEDVHTLSSKVDQLAQISRGDTASDAFAVLEQRIAALASTLESRQPSAGYENTDAIEGAVRALVWSGSTACRSATTAPPRSPISNSACRICSNGSRATRPAHQQSRPG